MRDTIRIVCAVPSVTVGDVKKNTEDICNYIAKADAQHADIVLFPELSVTGYSCGDLFFQDTLWNAVKKALRQILRHSSKYPNIHAVVGFPMRMEGKLYNCAAMIAGGEVKGIVPKANLSEQGAYSESRWFSSADALMRNKIKIAELELVEGDGEIPMESGRIFTVGSVSVGIEICSDLTAPAAPSDNMTQNGAEVILNLSASPELVGKRKRRRALVQHQSQSCRCVYAYCSAGYTESTSNLVFSGHSLIAENGRITEENQKQIDTDYMIAASCDLDAIRAARKQMQAESGKNADTEKPLRKLPFVPSDPDLLRERCLEVFHIQVAALKQRLGTINARAVIGVSGGLDSTLALLVAAEAIKQLERPMTDVHGVTMPCFGTSDRTYQNALQLMKALGITAREINIRDAVTRHFADIGHDIAVHNGTYENAQARERTQVLMDYASVVNGVVIGTGDLSELALGWCTYNGDHMSMYSINSSVPKTLIPHIIRTVADMPAFASSRNILQDILDTPISPELLPPDESGKIAQQTEDIVGPYALHDFFLYHMLRNGYTPAKIYTIACQTFAGEFEKETVKKWMEVFYRRFFSQQFKRNCMPDGVKVGSVSLNPRGDWQMPGDASARIWLDEIGKL